MEEREQVAVTETTDRKWHIFAAEAVCIAMLLASVLVTKNFFPSTYKKIKNWYDKNICAETTVEEVLSPSGDGYEI